MTPVKMGMEPDVVNSELAGKIASLFFGFIIMVITGVLIYRAFIRPAIVWIAFKIKSRLHRRRSYVSERQAKAMLEKMTGWWEGGWQCEVDAIPGITAQDLKEAMDQLPPGFLLIDEEMVPNAFYGPIGGFILNKPEIDGNEYDHNKATELSKRLSKYEQITKSAILQLILVKMLLTRGSGFSLNNVIARVDDAIKCLSRKV